LKKSEASIYESLEIKKEIHMLASLLESTNQIKNIQVKNFQLIDNEIHIFGQYVPQRLSCPCCGDTQHSLKGTKTRKLRLPPIGSTPLFLVVENHRLKCGCCEMIWLPQLPFVRGKRHVTISFEQYVEKLMCFSAIDHIARFLGVSWKLIKDIHKTQLRREHLEPNLNSLLYIGIDEFSLRKGHNYMTIFIDLQTGAILHAVEGKGIQDVKAFMHRLAKEAVNLKAVAMDMNAPYARAFKDHLPTVDIVYDRFHVMKLLNDALEEVRREQQNKCNAIGLKTLKGCRFLLLKNYENLDPSKQTGLSGLLQINKPLAIAHTMKEQLRMFWNKISEKDGGEFLSTWLMDAFESGVGAVVSAGKTLLRRWKDLLNYFKHRLTNGKTEGINNKIKTMKRQAYGFTDMEYFKLRLYSLHKVRYAFVR
jgi:transposase